MLTGLLIGTIVATGAAMLLLALAPTTPQLGAAIARLGGAAPLTPTLTNAPAAGLKDRLGAATERALAGRSGFTTPTKDLQLIGKSTRWYWSDKASASLVGFTAPIFLGAINLLMGSPIPTIAPLFISIAAGAWFWVLPDAQVRKQANAARDDFARAAVSYLQLMCINRSAGDGPVTAMRGAAEVSDAWMFVRIREEIARATLAGVPAWDGLTLLGERTGIPGLAEIGDIMRMAGEDTAGVGDALMARARSMRDAILTAEHEKALAGARELNYPLMGLVGLVIAFVGVPVLYTFLTA